MKQLPEESSQEYKFLKLLNIKMEFEKNDVIYTTSNALYQKGIVCCVDCGTQTSIDNMWCKSCNELTIFIKDDKNN